MTTLLVILLFLGMGATWYFQQKEQNYISQIECSTLLRHSSWGFTIAIMSILLGIFFHVFLLSCILGSCFFTFHKGGKNSPIASVFSLLSVFGIIAFSVVNFFRSTTIVPEKSHFSDHFQEKKIATLLAQDIAMRMNEGNILFILPDMDEEAVVAIEETVKSKLIKPGFRYSTEILSTKIWDRDQESARRLHAQREQLQGLSRRPTAKQLEKDIPALPVTTLETSPKKILEQVEKHADANVIVIWPSMQKGMTKDDYETLKTYSKTLLYVVKPYDMEMVEFLMEENVVTGAIVRNRMSKDKVSYKIITTEDL